MVTKQKEQILLAIPSFQDPHLPGKPSELGNIATLLRQEVFERVFLIGLSLWKINAFLTEHYINQCHPKIQTGKKILSVTSTSTYKEIFYALKQTFDEYHDIFANKNYSISFLLPPTFCDKLLDCWLLLITSLNLETKIYQIEPHYSLEAISSDKLWNKSLDWLGEKNNETHETIPCFDSKYNEFDENLDFELVKKLTSLRLSKHLLILGGNKVTQNKVSRWVHKQTQNSGPLLNIACEQLPSEICSEILFGYKRQISRDKSVEKKWLFYKGDSGIIHVSTLDSLPLLVQSNIADFLDKGDAQHLTTKTRFIFSTTKTIFREENKMDKRLVSQLEVIEI